MAGTPVIRSPNPNSPLLDAPGPPKYQHGADLRRGPIPMAFQITSPFDPTKALLPHALILHVNPSSLSESHTKKIERFQTLGGFVEQHWPDDLSELSADGSTGAFMNIYTGATSVLRQRTIAWDRFRDLYDVFHNNGSVYDPFGNIVLQGNVMIMYDRGTFVGYFRTFDFEETDDSPFMFKVSWAFKIQQVIVRLPGQGGSAGHPVPAFQRQNNLRTNPSGGVPVSATGSGLAPPVPGAANSTGGGRK